MFSKGSIPCTFMYFVPVIRFIASSDIHITTVDGTHAKRTKAVYEGIAAYFANPELNSGYAGLDAITIAGDITDNGKADVVIMGNNDGKIVGAASQKAIDNEVKINDIIPIAITNILNSISLIPALHKT